MVVTCVCFGFAHYSDVFSKRALICQTMRNCRFIRTIISLQCSVQRTLQLYHALPLRFPSFQQPNRTFTGSSVYKNSSSYQSSADDDFEPEEDIVHDVLQYKRKTDLDTGKRDVAVIMPRQKAGAHKKTKEKAQFLLDETITLAGSVSGWKVVGSHMISTAHENSKTIFGKTNLQYLKEFVHSINANAVIFARDIFTPVQHYFFQDFLNVEVYDRFSVVLKIFRERASSKEAKLQLALAELNYVRKNLHFIKGSDVSQLSLGESFGGSFDTFYQIKKKLIQEKEIKLKKLLEKVDKNNALKKQHRVRVQIPSVAVVGYTNSGKTSLIKALTHDTKLVPEDKLFATLDVSVHMAHMPSNLNVLLIDTIGFITEIPTTLIHSFRSTLSEICSADLLLHITDSSHPAWQSQVETVQATLREINVPQRLIDSMIEVSNKVDKIEAEEQSALSKQNRMLISATQRIGLDQLKVAIEKAIIANTDRLMFNIRVPNGGDQYQWLYREASIVECQPDEEDANYIAMKVIVTKSKLGKFIKHFGKSVIAQR